MPNYADSKIYKMECKGLTYIGSTTQPTVAHRLAKHKYNYKYYINGGRYHYVTSFELFEVGTPTITLLENVCCQTKDQLHARERYWIENTECVNRYIPGRLNQESNAVFLQKHPDYYTEYYKNNSVAIAKNQAKYRKNNADKIREYKRKYRESKKLSQQCIDGTPTSETEED